MAEEQVPYPFRKYASPCEKAYVQAGHTLTTTTAKAAITPIFCHQQTTSRWNLAAKAPSREFYFLIHVRRTPPASAACRIRMKRIRFRFVLMTHAARRPYLWMQSHIHSIACGIGTVAVARIRQITSLDARKLRSDPARASGKVAPRDHRRASKSWASKLWDFRLAACVSSNSEHKVDTACP
jgi:hypothetical protein